MNLRVGDCVDDGTREWINPPVYGASGAGKLVKSEAGNTITLDDVIRDHPYMTSA